MNNRLTALRRSINKYKDMHILSVSEPLYLMTIARIDRAMGRGARLTLLRWVFNDPTISSSHDLTPQQQLGILEWARPHKPDGATKASPWLYAPAFFADLEAFQTEILGQTKMEDEE